MACTHGDEVIGRKVFGVLSKLAPTKGRLIGLMAHPRAVSQKKRFFKTDLNRSFPGTRRGDEEAQLAQHILRALKNCSIVIDIHGTNSDIDQLAIVTKWNAATRSLLAMLPISKVMYSPATAFAKGALVSHVPAGVALEYGPDKRGLRYSVAVKDIQQLLINKEIMVGKKKRYPKKLLFTIIGTYPVSKSFVQSKRLKDFQYIKKGEYIGRVGKKKLFARKSFYPIFLGKGRYPGILALMASRRRVLL